MPKKRFAPTKLASHQISRMHRQNSQVKNVVFCLSTKKKKNHRINPITSITDLIYVAIGQYKILLEYTFLQLANVYSINPITRKYCLSLSLSISFSEMLHKTTQLIALYTFTISFCIISFHSSLVITHFCSISLSLSLIS